MFEIKRSRQSACFQNLSESFQAKSETGASVGLLELGIVSLSLLDLYLFWGQTALPFQIVKAICLGILIFLTLVMLVVIPSLCAMIYLGKKCCKRLILASFNFPWFFLMLAILFLIVMILYLSAFHSPFGWGSFLSLFGFGLLVFLQAGLMERIFTKYQ